MKSGSYEIKTNLAMISIAAGLFILLGFLVKNVSAVTEFDWQVLYFVDNCMRNISITIARELTDWGMERWSLWPALIACCVLVSHRRYLAGILIPLFVKTYWPVCLYIKDFVARPRPISGAFHSFSFPSGHAFVTTIIYGMIIAASYRYIRNSGWRNSLIIASSLWIFTVCWTRMWLHAHFLTDVIAGCLLGIIYVNIYIIILKLFNR